MAQRFVAGDRTRATQWMSGARLSGEIRGFIGNVDAATSVTPAGWRPTDRTDTTGRSE